MEALKFNLLNPLVVKYWYSFFAVSSETRREREQWQQPKDLPRDGGVPPP